VNKVGREQRTKCQAQAQVLQHQLRVLKRFHYEDAEDRHRGLSSSIRRKQKEFLTLVEWQKNFINSLTSVSITLLNYEERYKTMSTTIMQKRRAVSPVIATVILIAVAVALGIAVAFWASGLTSSFSKYEKLGVSTQYAISETSTTACSTYTTTNPCWQINLGGQNTGSSDATITQIQINGVPYIFGKITGSGLSASTTSGSYTLPTSGSTLAMSVKSGQSFQISLLIDAAGAPTGNAKTFASGQTVQVTIITAAGNNYPASIVLP
jgi:flagellin-like protein